MDKAAKSSKSASGVKKAGIKSAAWPVIQHPILEMERAFDRFLERNWPVDGLFQFGDMRTPSLDVVERDKEVIVRAEMPGVDKKDIKVTLADNVLTIKGQTSKEETEEKGDYYRNEISSSSFARSVTIPSKVDIAKSVANFKDGILEIKLPKLEPSKQGNIAIN